MTERSSEGVTAIASTNFIITLLMGGSLQKLWELIRAMQFIILSFLIRVPLSANAFAFFEGIASIGQIDIFDGKEYYQTIFEVKETTSLNSNFELFDIEGKNFLINSGSYFIFFGFVIVFNLIEGILNIFAKVFSKQRCCRKIGMKVWSKSQTLDIVNELFKLFIESYFDIAICIMLHNLSMVEKDKYGQI